MEYSIHEKPAFEVIGVTRHISSKNGENLKQIPKFWSELFQNGDADKLFGIDKNKRTFGICMDFQHEQQQFKYMIAVEPKPNTNRENFSAYTIPASKWAVFTSIGPMPQAIQQLWGEIFTEWFPNQPYKQSGGPELEVYPNGDTRSADYRCEVWIPILDKE